MAPPQIPQVTKQYYNPEPANAYGYKQYPNRVHRVKSNDFSSTLINRDLEKTASSNQTVNTFSGCNNLPPFGHQYIQPQIIKVQTPAPVIFQNNAHYYPPPPIRGVN